MNRHFAIGLCTALVMLAGGERTANRTGMAAGDPLEVVSTFSVLADIVKQVGGDHVEITTLVTPNMDAHSFEPSPDQIVGLSDAAVIFEIGIGFEPWLDGVVDAARPDARRVIVSEGVELRSLDGNHVHEGEGTEGAHGSDDPHIWQNPLNVVVIVENITSALVEADPAHRADYESNASAYVSELRTLDAWIEQQVATIPPELRKLVTSHDTLGYYAERYGFEVIGTPLGVSTASSDPSARDVAQLIDAIVAAGVPAVFMENVGNPGLMEQIAENAGVVLAPPLYTDALGDIDTAGSSYLGMMRFNTETIVSALTA